MEVPSPSATSSSTLATGAWELYDATISRVNAREASTIREVESEPMTGSSTSGGGAIDTGRTARPGQRRVGGRTGLQQLQRQSSREKLLAAAYDSFALLSYAGTSVDDIVRRAKVNRSTFYRHFDSKFAVAKALFDAFWPRLFAEWDQLAKSDEPTDREISDWVTRLVGFYRANRPFFFTIGQIAALETEGLQWEETIRLEVIHLLGQRFAAFRRASSVDATPEARVRVRLVMLELEMCVFELAFHEGAYESKAVVAVMISEFRRFLHEGSGVS
jgi:AcrR family transcriptional regulator